MAWQRMLLAAVTLLSANEGLVACICLFACKPALLFALPEQALQTRRLLATTCLQMHLAGRTPVANHAQQLK